MKPAILALTAVFVTAVPLAWAQEDTSPTPAATPETTAPAKSETTPTDPTVSVTTEKSATPAPSASSSPAATSKASPSTAKSTSTKTTASPSPAGPAKKMSPEATLRDQENRWEAATTTHDSSVAAALLADDYVGVNSKGKFLNRGALLNEIKKDKDTYTSAKNGKMNVRFFGAQYAVVTGTSTETGKDKDGKAFNRTYRWTDVWVERQGKWQCVSSQANLVAK